MKDKPSSSDVSVEALRQMMKGGRKEMGLTLENTLEDRIEHLKKMARLKQKLENSKKNNP